MLTACDGGGGVLPRLVRVSIGAGLVSLVVVALLVVLVSFSAGFEFALGLPSGYTNPFAAEVRWVRWVGVILVVLNLYLVPVLIGAAAGALIGLSARQRPPRGGTALEASAERREEEFGQYDKPESS